MSVVFSQLAADLIDSLQRLKGAETPDDEAGAMLEVVRLVGREIAHAELRARPDCFCQRSLNLN
jgi:hypothetical protein